jgi:hypothetical protein
MLCHRCIYGQFASFVTLFGSSHFCRLLELLATTVWSLKTFGESDAVIGLAN